MIAHSHTCDFRLHRDAWHRLVFVGPDGQEVSGARPVRLFPLTDPKSWISLVAPDGHELRLIEDPQHLPEDIRELILEDLSGREFLPVITRIVRISSGPAPARWEVETDRGPTEFTVASDEDICTVGDGQILISDSYGARYVIPSPGRLDAASRKLLNRRL